MPFVPPFLQRRFLYLRKWRQKSAAIANIDMSWPYIKADNKAATKAINSDLRVYMDDFRYDYMYRKFLSGRTWFENGPTKIKILPV